ncbi:gas vesicle protein [Wenyingzhuangia heitensis]|uniref:Gas vesicle protein n=1 Tax=Wenyingzhuangia heitensis TaxID=1487859 RepID=A0ABX0U8L6_9FLAO|nr:YtxH domain-containing protein [Wenyingzhuangia heitensis]NIJ45162.1 gas vesicle protein [Wenyingzhuangia heitensis]
MNTTGKVVLSLFAGVLIGTAAGVLFAPKKGEETREDIKNKILELKGDVLDLIEKGEDIASEKIKEIKAKIASLEKDLKNAMPC